MRFGLASRSFIRRLVRAICDDFIRLRTGDLRRSGMSDARRDSVTSVLQTLARTVRTLQYVNAVKRVSHTHFYMCINTANSKE
jgi:hypothetical protein